MLVVPRAMVGEMVAAAYAAYPFEFCGLLAGPARGERATSFTVCRNAAGSARVYTLDPLDHLRAERAAEARGWEIIGVVHSHTHSEPYPSPTDVAQAPDPGWHYVIVGLKRESPEIRGFRIVDGSVSEVALRVT